MDCDQLLENNGIRTQQDWERFNTYRNAHRPFYNSIRDCASTKFNVSYPSIPSPTSPIHQPGLYQPQPIPPSQSSQPSQPSLTQRVKNKYGQTLKNVALGGAGALAAKTLYDYISEDDETEDETEDEEKRAKKSKSKKSKTKKSKKSLYSDAKSLYKEFVFLLGVIKTVQKLEKMFAKYDRKSSDSKIYIGPGGGQYRIDDQGRRVYLSSGNYSTLPITP